MPPDVKITSVSQGVREITAFRLIGWINVETARKLE